MSELTVADGFVEINENLGDMIKYIANEPSVGLYYIQQHAQNAVPNVVKLKNTVTEKSNEVVFHTEDLEDSVAMTRTMKQSGFPVIDEMIRDIKTSLTILSSKQPIRGVISLRSSSYQPWIRGTSSTTLDDLEKPGSYFSSVFKSAKEKAGNLKWPQGPLLYQNEATEVDEAEAEELPLSSQVENEINEESNELTGEKAQELVPEESDFDEFRAQREALLEGWLTSSGSVL